MWRETTAKPGVDDDALDVEAEQPDMVLLPVEEQSVARSLKQRFLESPRQARGVGRLANEPAARLEDPADLAKHGLGRRDISRM